MKKALALLMAGTMALSLAACGGSGSSSAAEGTASTPGAASSSATAEGASSGEAALTFSWWGNQIRNEGTQAAIDLYTEQNPGVTIDGQFSVWDDYWTKLATASAGHNLPDIVQMDYHYLQQYVDSGLLVDLQPYVDSGAIDVSNIPESVLDLGRVGDGLYAISIGSSGPSLVYNKTLLDGAGITVPDTMTIAQFEDLCREVYQKTGYKATIGYGTADFLKFWLRSQDLSLFNEAGDGMGVNSYEDLIPYFQFFETGISEGWMIGSEVYAELANGSMEQNPLVYGSSPETMSWCGNPFSNQLVALQAAADAQGIELAITSMPSDDLTKSNFLLPSQYLSISTDSANPDEAAKFINFWLNSVEANEILLGERGTPVNTEVANAIAPKLDEVTRMSNDYVTNVLAPNSSSMSPLVPEKSSEFEAVHASIQEAVCYGSISAEDAAKQLYEEGNAVLSGQ